MIPNVISDNPFRVLGLYSNATVKEITAKGIRMKAYAEVGDTRKELLHLNKILQPVKVSSATVDEATSRLSLLSDRNKWAMSWFKRADDSDDLAMKYLSRNRLDKARLIWEKRNDAVSKHNLVIFYLIQEAWPLAGQYAKQIYLDDNDIRSFALHLVSGTDNITYLHLCCLPDDGRWNKVLRQMRIDQISDILKKELDASEAVLKDDLEGNLEIARTLRRKHELLDVLGELVGKDDALYSSLAERYAVDIWHNIATVYIARQKETPLWSMTSEGRTFGFEVRAICYLAKDYAVTPTSQMFLNRQFEIIDSKIIRETPPPKKESGCSESLFYFFGMIILIALMRLCNVTANAPTPNTNYPRIELPSVNTITPVSDSLLQKILPLIQDE